VDTIEQAAKAAIEEERMKLDLIREGLDLFAEYLDTIERQPADAIMRYIEDERRRRRIPLAQAIATIVADMYAPEDRADVDGVWTQLLYGGRRDERYEVARTMAWLAKRAPNPWLLSFDDGTYDIHPDCPFLTPDRLGEQSAPTAEVAGEIEHVAFQGNPPPIKAGDTVGCRTATGDRLRMTALSGPRYDDEDAVNGKCFLTVAVGPYGDIKSVNWPAEDVWPGPTSQRRHYRRDPYQRLNGRQWP
jgi:hypothetical protein